MRLSVFGLDTDNQQHELTNKQLEIFPTEAPFVRYNDV